MITKKDLAYFKEIKKDAVLIQHQFCLFLQLVTVVGLLRLVVVSALQPAVKSLVANLSTHSASSLELLPVAVTLGSHRHGDTLLL